MRELSFRRRTESSPRSVRGMGVVLALVAAAILTRPWWLPQPAPGVLVEVRGDVPHPGLYALPAPTLGAALAAAGASLGERADQRLTEGVVVAVVGADIRLERPEDPLLIGLPVDVNLDGEVALGALPGVGPSLAAAIVAERQANGAFASLDDLTRVRGLSPDTAALLRPYLTAELPSSAPVDLNHASAAQLRRLPGVGPALAERIVADRTANGPFTTVHALTRVRGIGPQTVARLDGLVRCDGATP